MILPLKLILLAIVASAQICQPEGLRQGYFSQYGKSPTDGTIAYHQDKSGKLPLDMSQYVGVIAVRDCHLVGDDAWIRITDERTNPEYAGVWLPVKIFDCSGHTETTEWMNENNILGELGYYLTNDLKLSGAGRVRGEMILEAPASIEMACEQANEIATPIPVYVPHGTLTIPEILTSEVEMPTETPTPAPLPTAAIIWRKVTSSARVIALAASPTLTPAPAMVEVPILSVQGADTTFDALENLPLIIAAIVFILWLGFGLLMFVSGILIGSGRDNKRQAQTVSALSDLRDILRKQYPGLQDDES